MTAQTDIASARMTISFCILPSVGSTAAHPSRKAREGWGTPSCWQRQAKIKSDEEVAQSLRADAACEGSKTVYVSAVDGIGLDRLRERIDAMIEEDPVSRVHLRVPQTEGRTLAMLEARESIPEIIKTAL